MTSGIYKRTDVHRKALSKAHLGIQTRLGKHWKIKDTSKMYKFKKGNKLAKGNTAWNKGLKGFQLGELHPRWIKDRTKLKRHNRRNDMSYKEWRKEVYKRDNWKCKINNCDCKGRLEAHHILSWRDFLELRYEVNNGITLCQVHHPHKRKDEAKLSPYFKKLVAEMK